MLLGEHVILNGPELEVPWQLPAGPASSQAETMWFSGHLHGAQHGEGWGRRCPVPARISEPPEAAVMGCRAQAPVSSLPSGEARFPCLTSEY